MSSSEDEAQTPTSSRDATDKVQRRLVLGFGADRSGAGRGGQARSEHRKAGAVDSEQLWATGTGSRSGRARAFGEKRKQNGAM